MSKQVADISLWGWVAGSAYAGIQIDEFPALKAWRDRMLARPGVEKGRHVPSPHKIADPEQNKEQAEKDAAEARKWILEGAKADAK
jgi:glutathione S-transferase